MATLVLTLIGDDRAGLVNAVARVVNAHGGNWERSEMAELGGKFAGIVELTVPDTATDALVRALEPLQGTLDITVHTGAAPTGRSDARLTSMSIVGTDRTGIVHEITEVLIGHGISIGSMRTETSDAPMAGGRIFTATATLLVPAHIELATVQAALELLANELMVDVELAADAG